MKRHLLGIQELSRETITALIANGETFLEVSKREIKKVPTLRGKTVMNLFLEPSTRTRTSFEIAAKRLSADSVNISSSESSIQKGETLLDTGKNLEAMTPDILVVRHKESGAPHFLAGILKNTSIINAGDGMHEHPSQALLDCLTIRHSLGSVEGIELAIVGDVLHSRVARSNILAHQILGNKVRLVGPRTLVYPEFRDAYGSHVSVYNDLREGLEGVDVVMVLRMQLERQGANFVPSLEEYSREFCVTEKILKEVCPNSVVLHPGPVNRGIEISTEVVDGKRSLISEQVEHGVAIRMAILLHCLAGTTEVYK